MNNYSRLENSDTLSSVGSEDLRSITEMDEDKHKI